MNTTTTTVYEESSIGLDQSLESFPRATVPVI